MPVCKMCGEEADELTIVRIDARKKRVCEECAEDLQHEEDMAEASEAAVQQMMGFTGRR